MPAAVEQGLLTLLTIIWCFIFGFLAFVYNRKRRPVYSSVPHSEQFDSAQGSTPLASSAPKKPKLNQLNLRKAPLRREYQSTKTAANSISKMRRDLHYKRARHIPHSIFIFQAKTYSILD